MWLPIDKREHKHEKSEDDDANSVRPKAKALWSASEGQTALHEGSSNSLAILRLLRQKEYNVDEDPGPGSYLTVVLVNYRVIQYNRYPRLLHPRAPLPTTEKERGMAAGFIPFITR